MKFQFLSLVLLGSFLRVGAMNVDVTEANIVLESKNFDRELEHNDISIEEEENNREVMIHNEEEIFDKNEEDAFIALNKSKNKFQRIEKKVRNKGDSKNDVLFILGSSH